MKPLRYRIIVQQDTTVHFNAALYPYDYVSESYTPASITPTSIANLKGAVMYQNDFNNRGRWVQWPKNAGRSQFSCPEISQATATAGYFCAAAYSVGSGSLAFTIEIICDFYERQPFSSISALFPVQRSVSDQVNAPVRPAKMVPGARDASWLQSPRQTATDELLSDMEIVSDLDLERLASAVRAILLRDIEPNPGPSDILYLLIRAGV
jgi:hypothetical protein